MESDFRLTRWLCNILYLCGMPLGPNGMRIDLERALILLTPTHPDHDELFNTVSPYLPQNILADFNNLRSLSRLHQMKETEAASNRLHELMWSGAKPNSETSSHALAEGTSSSGSTGGAYKEASKIVTEGDQTEENESWSSGTSEGSSVAFSETTEDGKTITTGHGVSHGVSKSKSTTKPEKPEQK